jgi:hypothetical protein
MVQPSHRRSAWGCIFLASLALGTALAVTAAETDPGYSFHASVQEVRLTFIATDSHNGTLNSIAAADIAVQAHCSAGACWSPVPARSGYW